MKKMMLILVTFLMITIPAAMAEQIVHVADQADKFTSLQIRSLEEKMQNIYEHYSFDTVIVTTNNSRGQTAQMYAADFYDEFRSYEKYSDGLIFSFNFDIGDYYEATRGKGIKIFSEQGEETLDNLLRPNLDKKDYYQAMISYLNYIENRLALFSSVDEFGTVNLTTTRGLPGTAESFTKAISFLPIIIGIGLIIGTIAAFVLKSKLQIAKPQSNAQSYSVPGSLNLRDSSEIYLYQTVTRTRIQENKSSGGGGGGTTFRSSGGGSYGGRGGKL